MAMTSLKHWKTNKVGRPKIFDSPEELMDLFYVYIEDCIENMKVPSMAGFRAYQVIPASSLFRYEQIDEYRKTFEMMRDILEDQVLNSSSIDGTTKKLVLTSKFNYVDKTSVEQKNLNLSVNAELDEENVKKLVEEMRKKYLPPSNDDDILS